MNERVSDERLLPCPFCGGKPRVDLAKKAYCQLHGEPSQAVRVYCYHDCPARPSVTAGNVFNGGEKQAREKAIAAWNRRQSPAGGEATADLIRQALHELDNVTALNDQDANCLGCAENLLRQALASPPPKAVTITDEMVERAAEAETFQKYVDANEARLDAEQQVQKLTAENERLEVNIARLTSNPVDHRYWEGRYRDEAAENEKLREVIQNALAAGLPDVVARAARSALETKEGGE